MAEKEVVTEMILYVDLKCSSCYKKVKKLLCKFPQIRGQIFDEDKNKVMITVVCCNPEKLRDKLCCKGGKAIKSIEIVEKPPVDPPTKKSDPPTKKSDPPTKKSDPPVETPVSKPTQPPPPPVSVCCQECYEGRGGGPCHYGYRRHVPPSPCPCYDPNYGYQYRPFYVTRCDCFIEENPQGCSIM